MKPTDPQTRHRKNKGSLSVFEEFAEPSGGGTIMFAPPLEQESLKKIEERTKLADLPAAVRIDNLESKLSQTTVNLQQTYNKVTTQPTTNSQQSYNKPITQKLPQKETYNKLPTQPTTQPTTNSPQSYNKPTTKQSIISLVGLQKRIVLFLYELCRAKGMREIQNISIVWLSESCETTIRSAQETIRRLEKKGFILRKEYKNGRGGWTNYELPDSVYKELFQFETYNKLPTKLQQTPNKLPAQPTTEPTTTLSSSSSVLNINNKTTTQPTLETSDWIESINLEAVQSVGITRSVLKRCLDLYPILNPENLEDLVCRFAEFMKEPKNRVQNARGFFIGLAKQLSEGITPLDHIETANDRLMREYTEKLREKKERQEKLDREAMEFEFETWLETLEPSKQIELIPENRFLKQGSAPHRAALKQHFSETIWPEKKQQILESLITAHEVIVF